MTHQSEQQLEKTLLEQLGRLGFNFVKLESSAALLKNLRVQLEKFNSTN